jgi:hypothetical protein
LNGVVIETTKYRSVTGQNRNGGFHIKWPKGDETRVSECDQLCDMCYQGWWEYQSVISCVACVIKGDETRVSGCDQLCGMCYQGW